MENLEKAVDGFEHAIQLDPVMPRHGQNWRDSHQPGKHGLRALEGRLPEGEGGGGSGAGAGSRLGRCPRRPGTDPVIRDWDWARAGVSFGGHAHWKRQRQSDDGSGSLAANLGRFEEAIPLYRLSIEIDPLNPISYHQLGIALYSPGSRKMQQLPSKRPWNSLRKGRNHIASLGWSTWNSCTLPKRWPKWRRKRTPSFARRDWRWPTMPWGERKNRTRTWRN